MSLRMIEPPAAEPVSVTELDTHSRLDAQDGLEAARLRAARQDVEDRTWRTLVLTTYEERYDAFPAVIRLQRAPVREIVSIVYVDTAGDEQTLAASLYQAHLQDEPCRIAPAWGQTWPSTRDQFGAVRMRYRAGYAVSFTADAATDLVTAADHWFTDGDAVVAWNTGGGLPGGLTDLARYFARDVSGDDLKLASTSGGSAIGLTSAGTGTHFLGEIPPQLREYIKMIAGELNERRELAVIGGAMSPAVLAAGDALIAPYRLPL